MTDHELIRALYDEAGVISLIEFFATLTPTQRACAWSAVRAQATDSRLARSDKAQRIFDALDERIR
jgi:hypothetical protein